MLQVIRTFDPHLAKFPVELIVFHLNVDPIPVEVKHLNLMVHQLNCDCEEEILALGLISVAVADACAETKEVQADGVFGWQRKAVFGHSGHNSIVGYAFLLL